VPIRTSLLLKVQLDYLKQQQLPGGQRFQQATVAMKFKMASKMGAVVSLLRKITTIKSFSLQLSQRLTDF